MRTLSFRNTRTFKRDRYISKKLLALDSFRVGDLREGVVRMCSTEDCKKLPLTGSEFDEDVEHYVLDPDAFHHIMNQFADKFEKLGL